MNKLALAAIATLFVASAYAAEPAAPTAPENLSAETMSAEDCKAALTKCGADEACVKALAEKGCTPEKKS